MAAVRPFNAVRPDPAVAPHVSAVPYDVVDTHEARALAHNNPLSFLHVSRAEIDLAPGVDPHDDLVYGAAAARYAQLKQEAPLVREDEPSLYLYSLELDGRTQTGLAGGFSVDEYRSGLIKKHERTRKDKEDDRTRHIVALRAQTGPVFLVHRAHTGLADLSRKARTKDPMIDFTAVDGVRHTIWRLDDDDANAFVRAFAPIDALYIADGHHRAASAARAAEALPASAEAQTFLAVAFPADELRILPYNRVIVDAGGRSAGEILAAVARAVPVSPGAAVPGRKGEVSLYVGGAWHSLAMNGADGDLDADLLQARVLEPVFGIGDVRTDARIDFVGGARGTAALEQRVDSGQAAAAFSMYPVSLDDLMRVSDAGGIMPPKSTWFEPKLRDGLLIHEI